MENFNDVEPGDKLAVWVEFLSRDLDEVAVHIAGRRATLVLQPSDVFMHVPKPPPVKVDDQV